MSPSNRNEFLASAGGRWFLDTRFLLLTTPLVITTSLLTTSSKFVSPNDSLQESWATYGQLFLANIFALALCAVWVILFSKTVFKNRAAKPVPLFLVILFSSSVGALKGAATGFGSWFLLVEPDLALAISSRVWQTTLLGAWLVPAIALVASRLAILQAQREALVAERVSNTMLETGAAQTRDNQAALRAFAVMAKNELSKISKSASSVQPNKQYALAIRKLVSDQLRPLSHRIWDQENKRISSFSFTEIARNAVFGFTQARAVVAVIYAITALPSILRFVPLGEAALRSAFAAGVIYVGFWLASFYKPRSYRLATLWFLASVFAIATISFITGELVFGYVAEFDAFQTVSAVWLWLTQLTFISAFLSGVRKGGSAIKQEFAELYGSESIDRAVRQSQARIQNRDFANYLHGQVQNKLLSVALGLEKGQATKEELQQALALVEDILKSLDSEFKSMNSGDLAAEMAKINEQWLGFIAITWNLNKLVSALETRQKVLLIQVVDEAISNAVRHGMAKKVVVNVQVSASNSVELEITDDGIGPRNGKQGLGTTFFKNVSNGDWSLEQMPNGGSRLKLNF